MFFKLKTSVVVRLCSLALSTVAFPCVQAQVSSHAPAALSGPVDERQWTRLPGNTRPEAKSVNDRGAVAGDTKLEHMFLQLQRHPEQEQALEKFLNELTDPNSPNFHQWISPQQFGSRFGLAQEDLAAVTEWLTSHGFSVNAITPNLVVDFSGTAAQVHSAFRTRIHHLSVNGKRHLANMSDPQIPASLVPAVAGVVSLNDFKPHPLGHAVANEPTAEYTSSTGRHPLVPADLGTIYNFTPAFQAGFSGQGQTIAVLEDSDIYSTGDWLVFRKVFGLARPYPQGRIITVHPRSSSGQACDAPGVNFNSVEAAIDAEWASAAAPSATIMVASCDDTSSFNNGVLIALQNLLTNGDTPPGVISISYGPAEASLGTAQNAFVRSLYQMAAAEGVSIFVAAGDSGAADYDGGQYPAYHGIAVNGYASTPYNVAVGGTDFADGYFNNVAQYWSSTNSPVYGSALSYVPEIPWNASCGSELLAASNGFATTYGATGFCNNGGPVSAIAGGGGPSGCASGIPGPAGVVGNTCVGYPKPSWQNIVGNPNDGVRDLPDVSLFASNNVWGHTYVNCFSDPAHGGRSCLGAPNTWSGYGGTSLSAPIMAGIQALVNQKTGNRWGNPNPVYYGLAAAEYGASGNNACDASNSSPGDSCTFHDVTLGDTNVSCSPGTNNCFLGDNPGSNGVLSLSNSIYQPAYRAGIGWDFSTGIGTVNVWNLLLRWPNTSSGSSGSTF